MGGMITLEQRVDEQAPSGGGFGGAVDQNELGPASGRGYAVSQPEVTSPVS